MEYFLSFIHCDHAARRGQRNKTPVAAFAGTGVLN
jgi:hypothetical protein